jgi:3-phosphoshikimate 1-carboxyvinyltransferase
MSDLVVEPARRVEGELGVPGDKAISHRALILAPAVEGRIAVSGLSTAVDVASTRRCVGQLGLILSSDAQVEHEGWTNFLELEGSGGWRARKDQARLDCGNSGSTMRMLMGALAGPSGTSTLVGDTSLSRRPMERVATPLRLMGAEIGLGDGGVPPVRIEGRQLSAIEYEMPVASAQVKTAVLLAGLQAVGETRVTEPAPTRDHTERMLAALGCETRGHGSVSIRPTKLFGDKEISIPGDFSSASFLLTAAAVLDGSQLTIKNVGTNPTRTAFLRILESFGAELRIETEREVSGEPRGDIVIRSGDRRPLNVGADLVPGAIDELPLVAVLGCFAEGDTIVRDAAELRVKESDRIATIVDGLTRMGARIDPTPDGFVVHGPSRLTGATVDSHSDHRIAMALAVAALGAEGPTVIRNWEAADVSFPGFADALATVTVR